MKQKVVVLREKGDKWSYFVNVLPSLAAEGMVIVFVNSKTGAEELALNLNRYTAVGSILCLHGDMDQADRSKAISDFKKGASRVLVATDVAARGLDIGGIRNVVNFDCATTIEGHVHRVGRTARGDVDGAALTLVTTRHDRDFAAHLVFDLENSQQLPVPLELTELAKTSPQWARLLQQNQRRPKTGDQAGRMGAPRTGVAIPPPPSLHSTSTSSVSGGAPYHYPPSLAGALASVGAATAPPISLTLASAIPSTAAAATSAPASAAPSKVKRSRWDR